MKLLAIRPSLIAALLIEPVCETTNSE